MTEIEAAAAPELEVEGAPEVANAPEPEAGKVPDPPATEQSRIASERQRAIAGDSGLYEQQPQRSEGDSANTPLRTSPLPAELQSGVPLAEDREAGVQPG